MEIEDKLPTWTQFADFELAALIDHLMSDEVARTEDEWREAVRACGILQEARDLIARLAARR